MIDAKFDYDLYFRWFQGFDWEGLRTQKMVPPIIPKVNAIIFLISNCHTGSLLFKICECKLPDLY